MDEKDLAKKIKMAMVIVWTNEQQRVFCTGEENSNTVTSQHRPSHRPVRQRKAWAYDGSMATIIVKE